MEVDRDPDEVGGLVFVLALVVDELSGRCALVVEGAKRCPVGNGLFPSLLVWSVGITPTRDDETLGLLRSGSLDILDKSS